MSRIKYSEMMTVYCNYCLGTNNRWFICKNAECRKQHKEDMKDY